MRPNGNNNNYNRRPQRTGGGGGGNRSGGGGGGNYQNNNTAQRRPQGPTNLRNQLFDSHGPNGERVRGNAFQVHEKYLSLARDAEERVDQENYYQHAEHFYRIVEAIQEQEAETRARFTPPQGQGQQNQGEPRDGQQGEAQGAAQGEAQYTPRPDRNAQHLNQSRDPFAMPFAGSEDQPDLAPITGDSGPSFSLADRADRPARQDRAPRDAALTDEQSAQAPRRGRPPREAVEAEPAAEDEAAPRARRGRPPADRSEDTDA